MDPKTIKDNRDDFITNQIIRHLPSDIIDIIISHYDTINKEQTNCDKLRNFVNVVSKRIGHLIKTKTDQPSINHFFLQCNLPNISKLLLTDSDNKMINTCNVSQLKLISIELGKNIKALDQDIQILKNKLAALCNTVANLTHKSVPISDNEDNNTIIVTNTEENTSKREICIRTVVPDYDSNLPKLTHYELFNKLGFVDTLTGVKICGNRGYFFTGIGVKFNMALLTYAIDFLSSRGFILMETPEMMNKEAMMQVSQLSDCQETLYEIKDYDKFLIATSEQPLTASFSDTILESNKLPIKLGGISTCFRKETGSLGKDTNGIFRVHQFKKVEQFCVTHPEESWKMFDEMINNSREFNDSLGLSYQVVNIVSGALNNAASMKYDLEGFFPGSNTFRELVSCSNCLDYFSKRIHTKCGFGDKSFFPHMLNSTLCANTRTICCIVESYQTSKGIVVPSVLRPYLGNIDFIPFIDTENK